MANPKLKNVLKKGDVVELTIDKLTFGGGRGLGRYQGFVVFVPFTMANEKIQCEISEVKKSFAEGRLLKILVENPDRKKPPCPHFTQCGGCQWQHLPYELQLETKESLLNEFLRNRVDPQGQPLRVKAFVPSPQQFNYRNRIQLQWRGSTLGYYKYKSHSLVPITKCPIADERINNFINQKPQHSKAKNGRVEFALTENGQVVKIESQTKRAQHKLFSQVNSDQNQWLLNKVTQLVASTGLKYFYDLYCGSGNFAFIVKAKHPDLNIVGVDFSEPNITLGQEKLIQTQLNGLNLICSPVEDFLLSAESKSESVVLVDPPRSGLTPSVLQSLLTLKPQALIYISCNPATLSRDLEALTKDQAYSIQEITGVDMFPQTDQIESITYLKPPDEPILKDAKIKPSKY